MCANSHSGDPPAVIAGTRNQYQVKRDDLAAAGEGGVCVAWSVTSMLKLSDPGGTVRSSSLKLLEMCRNKSANRTHCIISPTCQKCTKCRLIFVFESV